MHFRTYNHETGSNNGGAGTNQTHGAILEEIDEELAALLEDEDVAPKKNKTKFDEKELKGRNDSENTGKNSPNNKQNQLSSKNIMINNILPPN